MESVVLRPMKLEDQEMVMEWRTLPEITRYMNTDSTSNIEKQREWFRKQQESKNAYWWIIEYGGRAVGVTSISGIDKEKSCCQRGTYIVDKRARSFQVITDIYASQHDFVFGELNLEKIEIEVFEENAFVVKLNKLCGFREVELLRNHVQKKGEYHNIVRLELTRQEWEDKKKNWKYHSVKIIT